MIAAHSRGERTSGNETGGGKVVLDPLYADARIRCSQARGLGTPRRWAMRYRQSQRTSIDER